MELCSSLHWWTPRLVSDLWGAGGCCSLTVNNLCCWLILVTKRVSGLVEEPAQCYFEIPLQEFFTLLFIIARHQVLSGSVLSCLRNLIF